MCNSSAYFDQDPHIVPAFGGVMRLDPGVNTIRAAHTKCLVNGRAFGKECFVSPDQHQEDEMHCGLTLGWHKLRKEGQATLVCSTQLNLQSDTLCSTETVCSLLYLLTNLHPPQPTTTNFVLFSARNSGVTEKTEVILVRTLLTLTL